MADVGYVNEAVRKMYGIPLSKLTPQQRKILHEDSERRRKLIAEREEAVKRDNLKAFQDNEQFERVLKKMYQQAQKNILSDVTETLAKVERDGGTWSYANQSALTRSRGLFDQINAELSRLGSKEVAEFNKHLSNIYTDQFLRSLYTLGQTEPLRGSAALNMLNPRMIEAALNYPWSGAMFSDRLWLDKERLGRNLRIGLTQSMILGEGIPELTRRIQNGINTSEYNAERVARTEVKRVSYVSQVEAWKSQGVKEVRYMCANNGGDSRTCEYCKSLHGNTYTVGEEPSLPRHPNCRCWYVPVARRSYGDNELNELTGSVRGSENYEKWKQAQEAQLQAQQSQKPIDTAGKSEKLIELEKQKQDLQIQLDTKNMEYKNVESKYQAEIDRINHEKAQYQAQADEKKAEMDKLHEERSSGKFEAQRRELREAWGSQKISEEEYERRMSENRELRRKNTEAIYETESAYYAIYDKIRECDSRLSKISTDILMEKSNIRSSIDRIARRMEEVEKKMELYIKYPGRSDTFIDIVETLEINKVATREVMSLTDELTDTQIIEKLAGGDMTKGSCSSLAFSYIANRSGLDVIDYRGGVSQECFSRNALIHKISELPGVKAQIIKVKKEAGDTAKILQGLEKGKEYYLAVGRHAAIVRNTEHGLEYLELQSGYKGLPNGWTPFTRYGTIIDTLNKRFGCRKTANRVKLATQTYTLESSAVLMDVSSFKGNDEYREIMRYINTAADKQKKGAAGSVK